MKSFKFFFFSGGLLKKLLSFWIPSGPEALTATDLFIRDSRSTEMTTTASTTTTTTTT